VAVDVREGEAVVSVDAPSHGNLHGMFRTLVDNMVKGVTEGFTRVLEIVGVGYKAEMKGENLFLTLGYSHPIIFELPEGVKAEVEGVAVIKVTGTDKELVGETAARIRRLRKPDVYKNKGIRYRGERLIKKVGKAGGK
jgi:large subunit ribosomal protein L6